VARSRTLRVGLADDVITTAEFAGNVRFEEQGLQASAASAQYDPAKGTLKLSGAEAGRGPRVADERISVEAESLDVTLAGRQMTASRNVRATLRPRQSGDGGKLPGLLQQLEPATVNADTLDYRGATGKATFSGRATLVQGQTAIRGGVLTLDQSTGDLLASGGASSNLVFDTGLSIGRAAEIRYEDSTRRIAYSTPVPPSLPGVPVAASLLSQVSGPPGDLRATRIEVVLGEKSNSAARLEAFRNVNARVDTRVATGDRLTYYSEDERYVMSGIPTVPVKVVEGCRETTGRTVVFYKSGERIIVDGNEETRTQSKRGVGVAGGPCAPQPAR
jgi:lipopolysaccharide export system protein LptA